MKASEIRDLRRRCRAVLERHKLADAPPRTYAEFGEMTQTGRQQFSMVLTRGKTNIRALRLLLLLAEDRVPEAVEVGTKTRTTRKQRRRRTGSPRRLAS